MMSEIVATAPQGRHRAEGKKIDRNLIAGRLL